LLKNWTKEEIGLIPSAMDVLGDIIIVEVPKELEKKEKELILKALRKHNNKRKYAASDLGISERTLYRKIKEYEIDQ